MLQRRGYTFCAKAGDAHTVTTVVPVGATPAAEPAKAPAPASAEVLAQASAPRNPFGAKSTKQDPRPEVAAPAVNAATPEDPPGLRAWSSMEAVRQRLGLLSVPTNGGKDQM